MPTVGKRNAHAVAARQRKAGPHREDYTFTCDECGKDMGFNPPSHLCAPCYLGIHPEAEDEHPDEPYGEHDDQTMRSER